MSIVKKRNVYFFRGYVPKKLLTLLMQKTFDKSLKTKNKNKAIIKSKHLAIKFKFLMKELEAMIENSNDIYTYLDKYLNKTFKQREDNFYSMPILDLEKLYESGYFIDNIDFLQHVISKKDFSIINEYVKEALNHYENEINDSDIYSIKQYIAEKLLEQETILRENVQKGYYDIKPSNNQMSIYETQANTIPTFTQKAINEQQTNNLQYYINEFLDLEQTESSSSIDAISLRETALKALLLEFGDIDVKNIELKDLRNFRNRLEKLPHKSLAKTNKHYQNAKSLMDIININKTHKYTEAVISEGTIGKYIRIVKSFFKFLNDNNYIEKNIAFNLKPKKHTSIKTKEERPPFSNQDLEMIFSSPFYTTKLEANINKKIEKVFAPIIALYSGMRLNEIASLYVDDIKNENGIYYFDINCEKDKTVKNKPSIRKIPIHKKIIEAGFLDYINSLSKSDSTRVWGNLTKKITNKKTGKCNYSSNISSWFGYLKNSLKLSEKKVFHSTRHTAINNLKQQHTNVIEIAEIAGHSNNSITIDRYSSTFDLEFNQGTINKISYDVYALDILIPKIKVSLNNKEQQEGIN